MADDDTNGMAKAGYPPNDPEFFFRTKEALTGFIMLDRLLNDVKFTSAQFMFIGQEAPAAMLNNLSNQLASARDIYYKTHGAGSGVRLFAVKDIPSLLKG